MFLSASRTVSQWLNLGAPSSSAGARLEGSPVDRAVFTLLIIVGLWVLHSRRIDWNSIFKQNKLIWLYFAFGAVSFAWSDYPFVAFKRWVKALGTVVMALVVLTEERPYLAIGIIFRRLAFVLLPLSVLFIKYYPQLGRAYSPSGVPMYTGVGYEKNALGQICLIVGIYFAWNLLFARKREDNPGHSLHYAIYFLTLPMIVWLLYMANSATSLACLVTAIGIFIAGRHNALARKPRWVVPLFIAAVGLLVVTDYVFDIRNSIIYLLGRKPDFTGRVEIWENYLGAVRNPLVGYGFEMFYLTAVMRGIIEKRYSAHNGYLEMYLNLGVVGVGFVLGWIISGLKKVHDNLPIDYPAAMLRLVLIVVVSLYSWTESTFAGASNMWFLMFLGVMERPKEM
jgi:hypothetical protein